MHSPFPRPQQPPLERQPERAMMPCTTAFLAPVALSHGSLTASGNVCGTRDAPPTAAAPPRRRRQRAREAPTCRTRRAPRVRIDLPETLAGAGTMRLLDGKEFDFASTKGKTVLLVNVATEDKAAEEQFAMLNDLYKRYKEAGLLVLAFPSNWFGQYEHGSDEEVAARLKELKVKFTCFSKLANFDLESNPAFELGIASFPGDIIWNFEGKFLFDKSGDCVARFDLLSTDDYIGMFYRSTTARDHVKGAFFGTAHPGNRT